MYWKGCVCARLSQTELFTLSLLVELSETLQALTDPFDQNRKCHHYLLLSSLVITLTNVNSIAFAKCNPIFTGYSYKARTFR